jgi:peptidoglycan/LPS O-acetylase OafA/YrhL
MGQHQPGAAEHALVLRELLHIGMEAALGALVMYFVAFKQRWPAVLGLGAAHGAALLVVAWLSWLAQGAPWRLAVGPVAYALVTACALLALRWQVKRRGWPM